MDYKRKLLIKYSLEFVVIVVGISVTFWIDEWNRNRIEQIQHVKDIESIIDDLDNDSLVINRVNQSLDTGRLRTDRLINLIELKLDNKIAALVGVVSSVDARPTAQSYDVLEDLVSQAQVHYKKLNKVLTDDLYRFNNMVSEAAVPAVMIIPSELNVEK